MSTRKENQISKIDLYTMTINDLKKFCRNYRKFYSVLHHEAFLILVERLEIVERRNKALINKLVTIRNVISKDVS